MSSVISMDLRERIFSYVIAGHSCRSAARLYGVSPSFAIKLLQRFGQGRGLCGPGRRRPVGTGTLEPYRAFVIDLVDAQPDITLRELADELSATLGVKTSKATLCRFLIKAGYRYKKNAAGTGTRAR